MKCPYCSIGQLEHYQEKIYTYKTPVTKTNKISKKGSYVACIDGNGAEGLQCTNCSAIFDYDIDSTGKIITVNPK